MARFRDLAELAERLAGEAGRLKKRAAIAEAIAAVEAGHPGGRDAGLFAMYLVGTPFAEADGRKLNAGGALLTKALLEVSGAAEGELRAAYRKYGDMGAAGFELMAGRGSGAELTLAEVAEAFAGMASAKTTAIRLALVEGLLRRASAIEVKYLLKLMLGDMRTGVKESLVEEAIAVAAEMRGSRAQGPGSSCNGVSVAAVRRAVMLEADLGAAVRRAFDGTLGEARMRMFHPLGFMLASPVATAEEAVGRFVTYTVSNAGGAGKDNDKSQSAGSCDEKGSGGMGKYERHRGPSTPLRFAQDDAVVGRQTEDNSNSNSNSNSKDNCRSLRDDNAKKADAKEADAEHTDAIEAFLEDKYDGMRAQVHCGDAAQAGRVAIYSRNREDVTESFPELEEAFAKVSEPLIFDGEILGWDLKEARALPFAVLGQRIGRKRVGNEWRQRVPVVFMAFDLMAEGGELLLERPLRERRNRLEAAVERLVEVTVSPVTTDERKKGAQGLMFAEEDGELAGRLLISPVRIVESAEDIERAYAEARARANEGVMLKAAGSVYQPGRRGLAWVKLKRELATLDVVVTGAEFGHGKRAGILSDYTFAVRDARGELKNVGKAYSGLTDAEIAEMSAWMMEHTLEDRGHFRTVEPLMVLEVAFNNVMRSGRHASGFALRFPRIVRIRTDKPVEEIDTVERVEEVYQNQVDKPVEE
jgi:DNA ligase 1